MKLGTKSLLFGVHQFLWHAHTVELAWRQLYGTPTFKEQICILIHDWGYWGSPEMDGPVGSQHPIRSALLALRLGMGFEAHEEILNHSRHLAFALGKQPSRLCWADKLSMLHDPEWFYLLRARATGEIREYRANAAAAGFIGLEATDREWLQKLKRHLVQIAKKQAGAAVVYSLLALLAFLVPAPAAAEAMPPADTFLAAIAIVENAPAGVRGRRGEIGPFQMMPANYRKYAGTDLERARKHLADLLEEAERRKVAALPFNLALFWNAGGKKTAAGQVPEASYDYAARVCAVLETKAGK